MKEIEDLSSKLTSKELSRYARHLSLPEIGIKGQEKLKSSSVLCIGSGGLGSPLLIYLAASGIGKIGIVDFDVVEESNLQRQIIHDTDAIGKKKTISAKKHLLKINPNCEIILFNTKLTKENALDIIKPFDIICDCTDNFPSRYLINDACTILKKVNIYGSVAGFEGQVSVFNLTPNSPNYRDLLPSPPPEDLIPSCAEGGVMGILPGIVGIIQSTEVIKIATGIGDTLDGRLLVFNALKMSFRELRLEAGKNRKEVKELIDYESFCSSTKIANQNDSSTYIENITVTKLLLLIKTKSKEITIIDVRKPNEFAENSIKGAISIPLDQIESGNAIEEIRKKKTNHKLYIYCKSGKRSLKAIKILKQSQIEAINLVGGIDAWKQNQINQ